ncbi:DUF6489 family protein [Azospirillum sp. sgz301742]|jgi:hypothetical protein
MKITIDVDCTPEEARTFLGLPDVKPMQEVLMREVQDRTIAGLHAMDPETALKTWLPAGIQGFEQIQKMFWTQMASAMGAGGGDGKK